MPDNTAPDPEKVKFWRAKIEEQLASGIPQAEFCRQNKLSGHRFGYWKSIIFPELRQPIRKKKAIKKRRIRVTSPYERNRLVRKWEKSGLTQAEFCRRERVLEWEFSDWKRRMKSEEKKAAVAARNLKPKFVEVNTAERKVKKAAAPMQQVVLETGAPTARKVIAEIQFRGGLISIHSGASILDLKNIITALMECSRDSWTF